MDAQPMLHYDVAYPDRLSRLLIFVKWLLILPHAIVLAVLAVALLVTSFIAWFAILFTGNYPRGMWDFALMVMRWGARVNAYVYLQRDEYPPFSEDNAYPVRFELAYPPRLSRGLIFIKWLLLIPHFIVLQLLGWAMSIVAIIAWFAILFMGQYPRGLFDFVTGYSRWEYRVQTYLFLMTDAYPPFSFDAQGGMGMAPPSPRPSF